MNWSDHITPMAHRVRRRGTTGLYMGSDFGNALWITWLDDKADNAVRSDAKFLIDEFKVVRPLTAGMRAD